MNKCFICNREVKNKDHGGSVSGIICYFCSKECEDKFEFALKEIINHDKHTKEKRK